VDASGHAPTKASWPDWKQEAVLVGRRDRFRSAGRQVEADESERARIDWPAAWRLDRARHAPCSALCSLFSLFALSTLSSVKSVASIDRWRRASSLCLGWLSASGQSASSLAASPKERPLLGLGCCEWRRSLSRAAAESAQIESE